MLIDWVQNDWLSFRKEWNAIGMAKKVRDWIGFFDFLPLGQNEMKVESRLNYTMGTVNSAVLSDFKFSCK